MIKIIPDHEGWLTQWDPYRRVQILGLDDDVDINDVEVHFSSPNESGGKAHVVLPTVDEDGRVFAEVPSILLTIAGRVDIYVFIGRTRARSTTFVLPRAQPEDYVYPSVYLDPNETAVAVPGEPQREGMLHMRDFIAIAMQSIDEACLMKLDYLPVTYSELGSLMRSIITGKFVSDATDITIEMTRGYKGYTSLEIPFAESIEAGAFADNGILELEATSSSVAYDVKHIGNRAFANCYSIYAGWLGQAAGYINFNNVVDIGDEAFENCLRLDHISLNNAISLGKRCFKGCRSIELFYAPKVQTIGEGAFYDCSGAVLRDNNFNELVSIPANLYFAWIKDASWRKYDLQKYVVPKGDYFNVNITGGDGGTLSENGSTVVPSGQSLPIRIIPDEGKTLKSVAVDGTDATESAVYTDRSADTCEVVSTAQYGFAMNSNGYYESQNKGISGTTAICKIVFNLSEETAVTIDYINYGYSGRNYGLFCELDSTKVKVNGQYSHSSAVKHVTYTVPAGEHYILVNYRKTSATNQNNDTLQFKIAAINLDSYYTYTIEDVTSDHEIVVTFGEETTDTGTDTDTETDTGTEEST